MTARGQQKRLLITRFGGLGRARELAAECRLWVGTDGARLYAYRVAGLEPPSSHTSPLRAPHHTASDSGLFGVLRGHQWRPGELALAHGGVLLLDEAQEFRRATLDRIDRAWREGQIVLANPYNTLTVPTEFDLVLCARCCPCGYLGSVTVSCRCTPAQIEGWLGPIAEGATIERIAE